MRSSIPSSSPASSTRRSTCWMKRCDSSSRTRNPARARRRLPCDASVCARNRSTASSSSVTPLPVVASVLTIGGRHAPGPNVCSDSVDSIEATVRSAPSRSALFTTKMSAISMMPALSACTSSPDPGTRITIDTSAVRTMSTSSCPTPTVSMRTMSVPAASSTRAASLVARASPPRWPRVAMLRMNTPGSRACACMRTRSPRTAPPLNGLVGSTATTPTERPDCRISAMSRSTSVLFPAPGGPVTPMRYARPVRGKIRRISSAAAGASSSMSEIARATARASPWSTRSGRLASVTGLSITR